MKYRWDFGEGVRLIRNVRNDGTYPGMATGAPLVRRGSVGHVVDVGTHSSKSCDYTDMAYTAARAVVEGKADRAVMICGTGIGMSIAANRNRGIRAAACVNEAMARLAREHNDANVLCLGRRLLTLDECIALIDVFFSTPFSGGERHCRRVAKMG